MLDESRTVPLVGGSRYAGCLILCNRPAADIGQSSDIRPEHSIGICIACQHQNGEVNIFCCGCCALFGLIGGKIVVIVRIKEFGEGFSVTIDQVEVPFVGFRDLLQNRLGHTLIRGCGGFLPFRIGCRAGNRVISHAVAGEGLRFCGSRYLHRQRAQRVHIQPGACRTSCVRLDNRIVGIGDLNCPAFNVANILLRLVRSFDGDGNQLIVLISASTQPETIELVSAGYRTKIVNLGISSNASNRAGIRENVISADRLTIRVACKQSNAFISFLCHYLHIGERHVGSFRTAVIIHLSDQTAGIISIRQNIYIG